MKSFIKILALSVFSVFTSSLIQANPTIHQTLRNQLPAYASQYLDNSKMHKCNELGMVLIAIQNHGAVRSSSPLWLKFKGGKSDKLTSKDYEGRGNVALYFSKDGKPTIICLPSKYNILNWSYTKHGGVDSKVNNFFGKLLRIRPFQIVKFSDLDFIHIYPDAKKTDEKVIISNFAKGKDGKGIKAEKDKLLNGAIYPKFIKLK